MSEAEKQLTKLFESRTSRSKEMRDFSSAQIRKDVMKLHRILIAERKIRIKSEETNKY